MSLQTGTRLGPYEIVSRIGAGGMGEIFRANDTRLDRTVAIKVLPSHLSSQPDLRERFDREARAISSLSHPHICSLYDVGHQDGVDFLVMEHLEGESLADRLARGPLPLDQVFRYGSQIADALERAHKAGIVHRDLKPGNVMITKSGAKLLDFGLARLTTAIAENAPTEQHRPLTEEGTLLGTFQYMAPEQVEGQQADHRTDIFALGALLYEMATGKRAFEGKSRASLIASILDRDPTPISTVQPLTPPALERVIQTCLAKEPDERWQSAHDVAAELRWIAGSSAEFVSTKSRWPRGRRAVAVLSALILGSAALGAAAIWLSRADDPPRPVVRFAVTAPSDAPITFVADRVVAISPDGSRVVYRGENGGLSRLYLRRISEFASAVIPGTEDAVAFTFSPDGRSIAFTAGRRLKRLALDGSAPVTLIEELRGVLGLDWQADQIYFPVDFSGGIHAIPAAGGKPRLLMRSSPERQLRAVVWPHVLPGGKALIATAWNSKSWDEANIVVHSFETGKTVTLIEGGTCARYIPTGHILFGRGNSLFAIPFDLKRLRTTGAAVPVINGIANGDANGEFQYATSANGSLVYVPGSRTQSKRLLVWADGKGDELVVPTPRPYEGPVLSPDGRTVAVTLAVSTFDVWQLDLARDSVTRVSFGGDDGEPLWTADGERIIWHSSRSGVYNLYWAAADGSSGEQRLTNSPHAQYPTGISSDGSKLLFHQLSPQTRGDLWVLPLTGDRKPQVILQSPFSEYGGRFSADTRWLLYTSDESGRPEIYVRPYPGPGGKWQVSTGGADGADWAHDGQSIVYRQGRRMFRVPLQTSPRVRVGTPQMMMDRGGYLAGWNLSPDGQRFLRVKETQEASATQFHVVLNWFDELKRRVGPNS